MSIGDFFSSGYGIYYGVNKDIRRSFDLKHKNYPIFKKIFDASNPSIVSVASSIITLENHFFSNGEKIVYSSGVSTNFPIGIRTTDFGGGIGITNLLPSNLYVIKIGDNKFRLAKSAEDALKTPPIALDITSVGVGSFHSFTSLNLNPKVIVAIDNVIQSPIVSTSSTTSLVSNFITIDDILYADSTVNIFIGDYIKINNEIMKVESVGIGTTNSIRVIRPWAGTDLQNHSIGSTITKITGNYNIIENTIHFLDAPYGNIPLSSTTNPPDERDWVGISTGSSFQGRAFMRSGVPDTSNNAYYKNFVFDDVSDQFNGIDKSFILKQKGLNITDLYQENSVLLINNIFQGPGLQNNYTLNEISGITSATFIGSEISLTSDINTSDLPSKGIIVSVGSTSGFGYQPLISAGGTCIVSFAGTISQVIIENNGSGYRAKSQYEFLTEISSEVGVGSTTIYIKNNNSIIELLNLLSDGYNCNIGISTFVQEEPIVSIGSSFINIGIASTISNIIPEGTKVSILVNNPNIGYANVSVGNSSVGISTITHIGFTTIINGSISSQVQITNPGFGFTTSNIPYLIIDDPISYSNIPLIYSSISSGVGSQATIDMVVGQESKVIEFEIKNLGYGYNSGDILTVPIGGTVGIPTIANSNFDEFRIYVDRTFSDKFNGWSLGELQPLDNIKKYFNGRRLTFPLLYLGSPISIYAKKGSSINIQDVLLVFVNDILQVPGEGYIFNGGSKIRFTEPLKPEDNCKILFYKGSGEGVDVIFRDIIETVKIGDDVKLTYNPDEGQPSYLIEDERFVTDILSIDTIETNPYFGPGNVDNETLTRPITWCRQTEDLLIDDIDVTKDRTLYEPQIYPSSYLIQPVGIGSSVIFVDNIRPFFNPLNENDVSLDFQNNVTMISQEEKNPALAMAVVSAAGTISSIIILNGGNGYKINPSVSIQTPIGISTISQSAVASINSGIVTSITITGTAVTGYSQLNPPLILIESPEFDVESNKVISYSGDFGIISGISTTTIGINSSGIIFDFVIPKDSYLRNSSVSGITTISGIQTGYYFTLYNSNVGNGIISLDQYGSVIGIATNYLDGIYQVSSVSIAQTSSVGFGVTYVAKVTVSVSDYNGLTGIGYSNYYGNFSWGRIFLRTRTKQTSYPAYTNSGYIGITSGTIVKRTVPLKYLNYSS